MFKYFFTILISLLFFNQTLAKDVSINENIDLEFVCDLEKKIIKNSEYNYQTFLAKDLNEDINNIEYLCAGINHMAFYKKFENKIDGKAFNS